jgi:hypothetical protein
VIYVRKMLVFLMDLLGYNVEGPICMRVFVLWMVEAWRAPRKGIFGNGNESFVPFPQASPGDESIDSFPESGLVGNESNDPFP